MNSTARAALSPVALSPDSPPGPVSRFRMWLALVGLAAAGLLCATPFLLPVLRSMLAGHPVPVSSGVVLLLQDVQVLVFTALLAAVGLWTAPRVGLDAPLVRARLGGQRVFGRLRGLLPVSVLVGSLGALAVLALSQALRAGLPADLGAFPAMPWWASATGAFYGAIVEELLVRWGLLSLFAFALDRLGVGGASVSGWPTSRRPWLSARCTCRRRCSSASRAPPWWWATSWPATRWWDSSADGSFVAAAWNPPWWPTAVRTFGFTSSSRPLACR